MTSNVTILGQSVIYLAEKSLVTNVRWRSSMAMDYNFVKASIFLSASSSFLLLTPSYRVCLSQVMRMICSGEDDDIDFPFSDTIYKPPSLYISGKVLYLHHNIGVTLIRFRFVSSSLSTLSGWAWCKTAAPEKPEEADRGCTWPQTSYLLTFQILSFLATL